MKYLIIFFSGAIVSAITYTIILLSIHRKEKPLTGREQLLVAEIEDLNTKIENTKKVIENVENKKDDNRPVTDIINNIKRLL